MPGEARNRTGRGGTSIQGRMALSMLYAAALVIPVVLIALFYIRSMNQSVADIVERDIEVMRIADRISLDFLQARRDEKNFLLYGDSVYLDENTGSVHEIGQLCARGRSLYPDLSHRFDTIYGLATAYRVLTETLFGLRRLEPGRVFFTPDVSRLRRRHQELLRAAALAGDSTARDSLLAMASGIADEMSVPIPGYRSLNDSIRDIQSSLTAQTDSISMFARRRVFRNRQRARQLSTWGQRNIVVVLLVVIVVLAWLIIVLPRRAVLPLKRITNALRRAEEGNLDIRVHLRTRDELGELARQLNRSFAHLRQFDERKVNRILQLERRFRLLINDISEGAIVVDRTPNVLLANPPMEELLGCTVGECIGKRLREFATLEFLFEPLDRVLAGSTAHQTCDIPPELPGSVVCIEALRDKPGTVIGALIVISNPRKPEPPDAGAEG